MPRSKSKSPVKRIHRKSAAPAIATMEFPAPKEGNTLVVLEMDSELVAKIGETLALRGTDIATYVRLQLRAFRSSTSPLTLADKFTFGKYVGEIVEDVCRGDPGYVEWVVANVTAAKFDVDVLRLLADLAALSRDAKKNGKVKTEI